MSQVTLNQKEIALLKSAIRKGDDNPDFQKFLVLLGAQLKEWSGEIHISDNTQELIQHFGSSSGKLSWRAILHSIFERTLGENLGGPSETCTNLMQTEKTSPVPSGPGERNRRVV